MKEFQYTVKDACGIHARPAGLLVGDEGDDGYLEIGRAAGNEGKGGVLARRSIVEQAATKPCKGVKPAVRAAMPSENDTAKYPSAIGTPSRIPSQNTLRLKA